MAMGRDRDGDGEDTGPERPGPEQPGPERPGPEQPGPEQPGPEQPGPEQAGPAPTRETLQAAFTAVAVVVALALFVSACATGGTGARDEGPARADSAGSAVASFTPSASAVPDPVEAVRLVKADPAVSVDVKRDLKPCVSDDYPVDVSSGDLTGGPASDLVVNVLSCGDGVGVGSYVYREQGGRYENVFKAEEPPVYAEIDRGYLVVTKQVYEKNDQLSNPSSENVVSYLWTAGRFVKKFSTHTDYGTLGDGEESAAPGG
ncbi:hypothetical protein [Streptomyces viridochromogenes]|uniref:Lipoprotein CseA n=1 Tax=Streptomyces viridochromogenes Tue57 TaxID=1160705 RepID=L8PGW8_STRVR|nr:hypothetical protein STVIR_3733 [Streptomyces viridochromogenes Tue57]